MKTIILALTFAFTVAQSVLCTGTKGNQQVKYVWESGRTYLAYFENGTFISRTATTLDEAGFVKWATDNGYKTECK